MKRITLLSASVAALALVATVTAAAGPPPKKPARGYQFPFYADCQSLQECQAIYGIEDDGQPVIYEFIDTTPYGWEIYEIWEPNPSYPG